MSKRIKEKPRDRFRELFRFSLDDISGQEAIIRLLCRPEDPSSLAVQRIIFGIFMVIEVFFDSERGLFRADEKWRDPEECRFPLFDFLKPLPLHWMFLIYLGWILGALGMCFGLFYRVSCLMFVVCYWYLLLLDKTHWHCHNYFFGLLGFLFLITDADRYWSLDGLLFPRKRRTHVPLLNYTLFRFQIMATYFIAGLKKLLTPDWILGYSQPEIAAHWVFVPFRLILTEEQISQFIVHTGGVIIDLSMGFLLFFDKTRKIAFFFLTLFNMMNYQIFHETGIGMFPWYLVATMLLFCRSDWPRKCFQTFPGSMRPLAPLDYELQSSDHCLYSKEYVKPEDKVTRTVALGATTPPTKARTYHKLVSMVTVAYILLQCFLPYSHGITKGNNLFGIGIYLYSWDMFVWESTVHHIRVPYVNKNTKESGYLFPGAWVSDRRWVLHPTSVKQYATCAAKHLKKYNIDSVEIYVDVWRSLNRRFFQRSYDPRVDIMTADWNLFRETPWVMPLLDSLSYWRPKLREIERQVWASSSHAHVTFVADFPGFFLKNFVHEDFTNTSITVLQGAVKVHTQENNTTLTEGNRIQLPFNKFHVVHTISETPSCYMYIYVNKTSEEFERNVTLFEMFQQTISQKENLSGRIIKDRYLVMECMHTAGIDALTGSFVLHGSWQHFESIKISRNTESEINVNQSLKEILKGERSSMYRQAMLQRQIRGVEKEMTFWERFKWTMNNNDRLFRRGCKTLFGGLKSLITGQPFVRI